MESSYLAVPNSPLIVMGDVTSHKKGCLEYRWFNSVDNSRIQ